MKVIWGAQFSLIGTNKVCLVQASYLQISSSAEAIFQNGGFITDRYIKYGES